MSAGPGGPHWRGSLGAIAAQGEVTFRVWAPEPAEVALQLLDGGTSVSAAMERDGEYWTAVVARIPHGQRYRYLVDGTPFPDPCSRSQPEGVHGPSEVIDPARFGWRHDGFEAPDAADLVVYESHIGTFTPEGTFDAAISRLAGLRELGVNAIEVMPVASFPGQRNWGYDGVALYAPAAVYGGPDGFRRFIDAAHGAGLAVILDVVYNHFGPDGNYTGVYSGQYLTRRHETPWGDGLNFDDAGSPEVRRFFRENLLHWLHEYHLDGFRFDATHAIGDESGRHILAELSDAVREYPRAQRPPYLIAESNENDVRYLRPTSEGGFGFDAVWADDFHHIVRNVLHSEREGYLSSYEGTAAELAAVAEHGFLYEGQLDPFSGKPRGTAGRDCAPARFVFCIQNHDQVGNRALGLRLGTTASFADYLAATGLLLLLPQMPLLFQGQEFAASTPFLFFTDHNPELGPLVTEGRRAEFAGFRAFHDPAMRERIPDPQSLTTFEHSKLPHQEARYGAGHLTMEFMRAALEARRTDPVLAAARRTPGCIQATPGASAVVFELRAGGADRLLVVNFGGESTIAAQTECTRVLLSSDEPRFGGNASYPVRADGGLLLPGHAAALLAPA